MKLHRIICLIVAAALPQLASASMPLPNQAFGTIEGILDFCAQVDSPQASQYQERKKQIVQGATEEEVTEARATQEYKDAYQSTGEELGKVPASQAVSSCKAYLQGK